jgi:hypothetical protein
MRHGIGGTCWAWCEAFANLPGEVQEREGANIPSIGKGQFSKIIYGINQLDVHNIGIRTQGWEGASN